MAIAIPFLARRRVSRYERRPRVVANREARDSLSRDSRWKTRKPKGRGRMVLGIVAGLGIAAVAAGAVAVRQPAPEAAPVLFPGFVAQAEASFPESLHGHTRALGGTLSDGREVPVGVTMLLPAHALEAAAAAPDALTRLAAPYIGVGRAITGEEMGERITRLASLALPDGVSRCYSYALGLPRRVAVSDIRTVHVAPLEIVFNPEC